MSDGYHIPTLRTEPNMALCPTSYTPRWPAVRDALAQAGPMGLTTQQLQATTGIGMHILTVLIQNYRKRGYMHSVGPRGHHYHHLTAEAASAAEPLIAALVQQHHQEVAAKRRQRINSAAAERRGPRKPSAQDRAVQALALAGAAGLSVSGLAMTLGMPLDKTFFLLTRLRSLRLMVQVGRGEAARIFGSPELAQSAQAEQVRQKCDAAQAKEAAKALRTKARADRLRAAEAQRSAERAARDQAREQRRLERLAKDRAIDEGKRQRLQRARSADARTTIVPTDARPGQHQVATTPAALPAPVSVRRAPQSTEVIVPDNVKRTVAPRPRGRFEVDDAPVIGGFATLRPGEYLAEPGFSSYLSRR